MREIKFRFRLKNINEYVYWDKFKDILQDQLFDYFNSNNIIPEQFTGLLDKNGKEIYEGDIVNLFYENDDDVYIIEWNNYTSRFEINSKTLSVDFDNYYSYELEVIGNIHDNKDLLK